MVYPHHRRVENDPLCEPHCYRCRKPRADFANQKYVSVLLFRAIMFDVRISDVSHLRLTVGAFIVEHSSRCRFDIRLVVFVPERVSRFFATLPVLFDGLQQGICPSLGIPGGSALTWRSIQGKDASHGLAMSELTIERLPPSCPNRQSPFPRPQSPGAPAARRGHRRRRCVQCRRPGLPERP